MFVLRFLIIGAISQYNDTNNEITGGDDMGKAKIISVINYKGGVGKTVSGFNIAAGLSFLNHNSVLLIDLDPQCSLSTICMKAYSRSLGEYKRLSDIPEEETINHVFNTYLNQDILDFNLEIEIDKLIKKEFYTGNKYRLKRLDFLPATMFMNSCQGTIKGLEDIETEIKRKYGDDSNSTLKRISLLAKFMNDTKLNELYDFIIFDCPPTNSYITQNALFVSDYYLVPTIMDDMGVHGVHHVKNIVENTILYECCCNYQKLIRLAPHTSYLSFLKTGVPKMLGIIETLRKGSTTQDQLRQTVEMKFPGKLFDSIIHNQVDISRQIGAGECCFISTKKENKNPVNVAYGEIVFEILKRTGVEEHQYARSVTESL